MTEQPKTYTEKDVNKRDMKITALRQSMAELVVSYEDKDADRRIEITELHNMINALNERLVALSEQVRQTTQPINSLTEAAEGGGDVQETTEDTPDDD